MPINDGLVFLATLGIAALIVAVACSAALIILGALK